MPSVRNVEELQEVLQEISDKADNYLHAATLPVSAAIHAEGLVSGMREIKKLADEALQ